MSEQRFPSGDPDDPLRPASRTPTDLTAYAGCWVALIGGRVAGVGLTSEAARQAARRSRPRERIGQVLYVPPFAADQRLEITTDDSGA